MSETSKVSVKGLPDMAEESYDTGFLEDAEKCVVLAHGGGGQLTHDLIDRHILPRLGNKQLNPLDDSAVLPPSINGMVFTTDAFVVQPLEFPGGDIGRLAVCGTVNDLAVMGATPKALSLAVVVEEGLELACFDRILDSIAHTADEAGVPIVTGDTKVVERRGGDGMLITTAGVGELKAGVNLSLSSIRAGDKVIVTGILAEHGLTIMSVRSGIEFDSNLRSDCAPLNNLVDSMLEASKGIRFMRDPTRCGLAGVLADIAEETGLGVRLHESALPISPLVRHTSELLGLDPLTVANEGKCVVVVAADQADALLNACKNHPLGKNAAIVGEVIEAEPPLVELQTVIGGARIVQRPYGEELPRIC